MDQPRARFGKSAIRRLCHSTPPAILVLSLLGIWFGPGHLSAQVAWDRKSTRSADLPIPNPGDQQTSCVALDVDNDGIDDFVVGERTKTPSVVWYKYNGDGWDKFVVDDTPLRPEAGGAACDVDGDGDLDLILGQDSSGSAIWWWENPCPDFNGPWKRRLIKNSGGRQHHDQSAADYDGDGRVELLSWNQKAKKLLLFEIPEDPKSDNLWQSTAIYGWRGGMSHEGFPSQPVDVDLDGKLDVVGGGRWLKHTEGTQFDVKVIDEAMRFTQCAAGQLVKGGRPEVVFSPGDADGTAAWYEWAGSNWRRHDLCHVLHGHTCEIGDIDGDGNIDIMIGEMGEPGAGDKAQTFIWYGDGKGHFKQTVALEGQGIHEGLLGDFNGDGRLDVLVKPYHHKSPRLDMLLNRGR